MRWELNSKRTWTLLDPDWPGLNLGALRPSLMVDAEVREAERIEATDGGWTVELGAGFRMECRVQPANAGVCLEPVLRYSGSVPRIVKAIRYGRSEFCAGQSGLSFGVDPSAVRVLEQANYEGAVRPWLARPKASGAEGGEPGAASAAQQTVSQFFTVIYDRLARRALLAGFESSERWVGVFRLEQAPGGSPVAWVMEYDTGEVLIEPGEAWALEPLWLKIGNDPWALLEEYGDRVAARHPIQAPVRPPVSWCSWYPYRLGVTASRLVETARLAAARLKPLGLSVIEADLGWEKGYLPNEFEENAQFSEGLESLSRRLREFGLELGVWKAPFMISEFSGLFRDHPDWMIPDEAGRPCAIWTWYWEPHGRVFALDVSRVEVRQWVGEQIGRLRDKGVRYFKFDFIGCVSGYPAVRRHNRKMATGAALEAARQVAAVIREKAGPDALILNCGGPEMPGTGHWPLLYVCQDTGNTGVIKPDFQRLNHQALACHLFKNKRWGWIQPSCLCVGLPGTVEEARLRATAAFMAGGQIDISDTLTTLPEDRWRILQATLPVSERSAKPVDLFEPVGYADRYDYAATCKGEAQEPALLRETTPGSVWHVHVQSDWDEWELVAFFAFETTLGDQNPKLIRFSLPLARLGLDAHEKWMAYEFWGAQALGELPGGRRNVPEYRHPGDFQDLLAGSDPARLDLCCSGYGCKLICLRRRRAHPWVWGTGFHQSCGRELSGVTWDESRGELRGVLKRPPGETGDLVLDGAGRLPVQAQVGGRPGGIRPGAGESWVLSIQTEADITAWSIRFAKG